MSEPTPADYRTLLIDALISAPDANTTEPDLRTLFTPSSHRLALDPDITVVRGARGTGKTFWAKALVNERLREIAASSYMMPRLRRTRVVTAFALEDKGEGEPCFPMKRTREKLVNDGVDPADLWSAIVLMALDVPEVQDIKGWADRVRWVRANPEEYDTAIAQADRRSRERGETLVLLFDALDHLHRERGQTDRLLSELFRLALELRLTTGTLRAKIFVRPDMYENAPKMFADASKLGANAADLEWSRENLYGLLFHQLGNHTTPEAEMFRAATGNWTEQGGRHVAPVHVLADGKRQEEVFITLAGPFMGTDRRKGHTYTWVPNHLQDGKGRVSPRTWLKALCKAAVLTGEQHAGHPTPLHYEAIRGSIHSAAKNRVEELWDDIGWAALAVEQLKNSQVPLEPSALYYAWHQGSMTAEVREHLKDSRSGSGPRDLDSSAAVLEELIELGVMTRRSGGAVDIPDIYRLAFNISRRGGVPRMPSG
ncbi:AAA family ATPase [Streptomyces sp. ACA25]|uniref:AAA family ATPase n=1 Tax=Streptomyces sp. ACA25 TaxID=3022596 RepID=UPI0023081D60|nr:AAA family ATPase [Streptomyces sp. ACA25]MDB1088775.1 AAA family ATPase [Streptomyces sp. ACA25]